MQWLLQAPCCSHAKGWSSFSIGPSPTLGVVHACICISIMWSLLLCLKVWLANSTHELFYSTVGELRPCAANACPATMPLAVWPVVDAEES